MDWIQIMRLNGRLRRDENVSDIEAFCCGPQSGPAAVCGCCGWITEHLQENGGTVWHSPAYCMAFSPDFRLPKPSMISLCGDPLCCPDREAELRLMVHAIMERSPMVARVPGWIRGCKYPIAEPFATQEESLALIMMERETKNYRTGSRLSLAPRQDLSLDSGFLTLN